MIGRMSISLRIAAIIRCDAAVCPSAIKVKG